MSYRRTRLKSHLPKQATYRMGQEPVPAAGSAPVVEFEVDADYSTVSSASDTARRLAERTSTTKRRLQRRATPLEILQQPLRLARRKVFDLRRFLIVIGLTALVMLLPTPPGLSPQGKSALALFVFTAFTLALEPAPLPIAALVLPVAQVALNIDTVEGAFAPFGRPEVFLILTSLFLAEALRKHGLTRRLALQAILLGRGKLHSLLLSLMLMTGLMSMWVLNTATTAVLIPVALTIAQRIPSTDAAKRAMPVLVLAVTYAASIGGMATIVGSGENAIASGALNQVQTFGFVQWMVYGVPVVLVLLPMSWWLLIQGNHAPNVRLDITVVRNEIERSGSLSGPEREIMVVMVLCVILWVVGDSVERWLGFPTSLLSSVIVSIGAVAWLSAGELIDWNDMKGVNWGVFLVIGAGFTLGDAMTKSGANDWIATMAEPFLAGLPYALILVVVMASAFVLTQFVNSVTLGAIFSPLMVALALQLGMAPARLVIPMILVLGPCYLFPSSSARMTLAYVSGAVERRQMLRSGLIVGLPSVLLLYLFFLVLAAVGLI